MSNKTKKFYLAMFINFLPILIILTSLDMEYDKILNILNMNFWYVKQLYSSPQYQYLST